MKKIWTQAAFGSGELDVADTPLMYVLGRPGDPSLFVNNTEVYHFDISVKDPTAALEFTIGRTNINAELGGAVESAQPNYFRGNQVVIQDAVISSFIPFNVGIAQPSPTEVLGQYYVHGRVSEDFTNEPIEALRFPGSSHPQAFSYTVVRVDAHATTPVPYHLNVWFDEY